MHEATAKSLTMFDFNDKALRVVQHGDGTPWFMAKDVCDVLEIGNSRQALSYLDDDEKNTVIINDGTPGNPRKAIINESGLYSLILRSRKPEAKAFKKWVTSEVLPAIRKDGGYIAGEEGAASGEMSDEELLSRAMKVANNKLERIAIERDRARAIVEKQKPHVEYTKATTDGLTKFRLTEAARSVGISLDAARNILLKHGCIQFNHEAGKGYCPTEEGFDEGYLVPYTRMIGGKLRATRAYYLLTPKGRDLLASAA